MAVLIDPPAWPAHGRLWSHLVSDRSLGELHAFAAGLGIPRRAFDLDHYDIPADRHVDALAAGAHSLGGRELVRRLIASGLRVPGRDRPPLKALRRRWLDLMPAEYEMGDDLLTRWREPHRVYHGPRHLTETLDAADILMSTDRSQNPQVAALALWFHDAVHDGVAGQDESDSAALARQMLARCSADDSAAPLASEVARLVLVTVDHRTEPEDGLGALVSDADLAILAADPVRYGEYTRQVRAEYAHVPDADFRAGRSAVLDQLLDNGNLYHTPHARRHWQDQAVANLRAELATLSSGRRRRAGG
jgi:predicted metal-dependent HD superfamily phosphohydrolase